MSMIKDMKTYLISQGVSVPVFLGNIPTGEVECVGLYRYAGQSPIATGDIERVGLQVRCKAESYEEADAEIRLVCAILQRIGDEINGYGEAVDIDGTKYVRVYPVQSAYPLGVGDDGCYEVVQNFLVNASLVK